jgi:type VI secretion system secreted protein Hcp
MRKGYVLAMAVVSCALLLATSTVHASMPFYVKITGENQGVIEGEVQIGGREGTIEGLEFHHLVEVPIDPDSGDPVGKRQHQTVIFTKWVEKSSPKLWTAMINNETLTEVLFKFYRPDQHGSEQHYYTVKLENASLVAIEPFTPQVLDPDYDEFGDHERVRLTYGKIIWTHEIDGAQAEDDRQAPPAQ